MLRSRSSLPAPSPEVKNAAEPERKLKTTVTVVADGTRREIEVGPSGLASVPLDARTKQLTLETHGAGLIVRYERPVLRLWTRAPEEGQSPVHLEVTSLGEDHDP